MSLEINLLIKKQEVSPFVQRISKIIQKFALGSLSLFILVTLSVFSLRIFFNLNASNIQNQTETIKKQIESNKATESLYLAFVQKVGAVDGILKERFSPVEIIEKVNKVLPPPTSLTLLNLNSQSLEFEIVVDSLANLQKIFLGLQNDTNLPLKEINMQGLEKTKEGTYQAKFQLIFEANKKLSTTNYEAKN